MLRWQSASKFWGYYGHGSGPRIWGKKNTHYTLLIILGIWKPKHRGIITNSMPRLMIPMKQSTKLSYCVLAAHVPCSWRHTDCHVVKSNCVFWILSMRWLWLVDHNPRQRPRKTRGSLIHPRHRTRSSVAARVAARVVPRVVAQMLAMDVRMTDHGHGPTAPPRKDRGLKRLELLSGLGRN